MYFFHLKYVKFPSCFSSQLPLSWNTKLSYPFLLTVFCNYDPQIFWLVEKISHWKKISQKDNRANKCGGLQELTCVPASKWCAYCCVLWKFLPFHCIYWYHHVSCYIHTYILLFQRGRGQVNTDFLGMDSGEEHWILNFFTTSHTFSFPLRFTDIRCFGDKNQHTLVYCNLRRSEFWVALL